MNWKKELKLYLLNFEFLMLFYIGGIIFNLISFQHRITMKKSKKQKRG